MRALPIVLLLLLLIGCKTQEPIVVHDVRTEYKVRTDTMHIRDSVIINTNTIVRQVDSAAMAEWGVRLDGMERAWLVLKEAQQNGSHVQYISKTDTLIKTDTIPVPYPVEKIVEKKLSKWQRTIQALGYMMLAFILGIVAYGFIRFKV